MDEQQLRADMRLLALEYMLARAYTLIFKAHGMTATQVSEAHKGFLAGMSKQTIGDDPVRSDMLMDEFQTAVEKLLTHVEEMMEDDR